LFTKFVFVVRTARPDETRRFYVDLLGGEVEKSTETMTLVALGPGNVEILTTEQTAASGMIALDVEDLGAIEARLREAGATVTYGPIDIGDGRRALGTLDPNGVSVNFVGE
jgi:catechol 2,3-dioxygenase-like lactoylglutathione lyase family enzyme